MSESPGEEEEEGPSSSTILGNRLINYLYRRRFLNQDGPMSVFVKNISPKEMEIYEAVNKSCNLKKAITFNVRIHSIAQAEQQILALKAWWLELPDDSLKSEISEILVPLACHMFLETLSFEQPKSSAIMLKRALSSLEINSEWKPLIDELLKLQRSADIPKCPHVKLFRYFKYEFRISPESLSTLQKLIVEKQLSIIAKLFHFRFDVTFINEEYEEDETEAAPFSPDVDEAATVPPDDKELDALINEINNKRLTSTIPPPLLLYALHRSENIVCGKVSADGKLAATGDRGSEVKVWGLGETKLNPQLHPSYFASIPVAAYTETSIDPQVYNDKQIWSLRGHCDTVCDVAFLADSQADYLVSVSFDSTMRVWRLDDYSCAAEYYGHRLPIWAVAVSPIDNYVATASNDKTARFWCLDRTYPLRIMAGHQEDVTCVAFHPNGTYMATGSPDRTIRMWSVTDGKLVRMFGPHPDLGAILSLVFSPNGQYLASAGDDPYIWLWDLAGSIPLFRMPGVPARVCSLDWSRDGSTISACTYDGTVCMWNVDKTTCHKEKGQPFKYTTKCSTLLSLQYSTKNALVAVGRL